MLVEAVELSFQKIDPDGQGSAYGYFVIIFSDIRIHSFRNHNRCDWNNQPPVDTSDFHATSQA